MKFHFHPYRHHVISVAILWLSIMFVVGYGTKTSSDNSPDHPSVSEKEIERKALELQSQCGKGFTPERLKEWHRLKALSDSMGNVYGRVITRMNLGFSEVDVNSDYLAGMKYFQDAYNIAVANGNGKLEATVACNIALLDGLRGYTDGIPYARKAYRYGVDSGDAYIRRAGAQTLAILLSTEGKCSKALEYAEDALGLLEYRGVDKVSIRTAYATSLHGLSRHREASKWFEEARSDSAGGFLDSKIYFHFRFGAYLLSQNEKDSAIRELKNGVALSEGMRSNAWRMQLLSILNEAYEQMGQTDSALFYQKQLNEYIRSSHDAAREKELLRMRSDLSRNGLARELDAAENRLANHRLGFVALTVVAVICVLFSLWFLRRNGKAKGIINNLRMKNKATDSKLQEALDEVVALRHEENRKYKGSSLNTSAEDEIFERIEKAMKKERIYLDPSLNKERLARIAMTNEAYISQVINSRSHVSVTEYINRYRIQYAVELLKQDKTINLQELPEKVGFNSITTFYRAFKSLTGLTPSKYQKNCE